MTKTLIVQPRHNYAPPEGLGHVYLPTSPLTFVARILAAGGDCAFADENIRPANTDGHDAVGASLVGTPYIPVVCNRFQNILEGNGQELLLGGVVVAGLTRKPEKIGNKIVYRQDLEDFRKFFGDRAIACTDYAGIARATGVDLEKLVLKPDEAISLKDAYEKISDADMRLYLEREISFYLSQGCNQGCVFCAAENEQEERYRGNVVVKKDLEYLTNRAKRLGLSELKIYLSNLDVFQNPEQLEEFFDIVQHLKKSHPGFEYRIRGLAITSSIVRARRDFERVIEKAVASGFHTVGMGVDGGNDEIRRNLKKGFVNDKNILQSMKICKEFGITPETIMVFGGMNETRGSLENALSVTEMLQEKFGAVPRPHVFKDLIPGNKYWDELEETPFGRERKAMLFAHPEYCQAMDFKALASSVCHPDPLLRYMVNEYYRRITALCKNPEDRHKGIIYPIAPEFSPEIIAMHIFWNLGRFDR